jgi:hypothetical protein
MSRFLGQRPVRMAMGLTAVIAVVMAMTITPMRTVADDFLNQFRVQKFAAITIPMDMLEPLTTAAMANMSDADREQMQDALEQLGTFESTFSFDEESLPEPITEAEARAQYGDFDVPDDLPDGFDNAPEAYVTEAGSASYTLNVLNAQEMIDELGLPIYALPDPEAYPTLEFSATIPSAVVLEYDNAAGEKLMVGQMASPQLNIPDGIDMNELREDILRLPGLPADLVAQLRSIDDWEHTLIVPVRPEAETDDISMNGEPALLIEDPEGSAVLWEDDGILYVVAGEVSGDAIRDVADSMQ